METERMGKLIARLREERGWTQRELAGRLAVTDKAVSRWENGYGLPDVSLLPALAAALGITVRPRRRRRNVFLFLCARIFGGVRRPLARAGGTGPRHPRGHSRRTILIMRIIIIFSKND